MIETPRLGDFVFIHLPDGLDPNEFGGTVRVGVVTDIAPDVLLDETMITLDDDGPRIYLGHIEAISNHGRSAIASGH